MGFANFRHQFFGLGWGHWTTFALPWQDTQGKTCGICNMATILKMKDPDCRRNFFTLFKMVICWLTLLASFNTVDSSLENVALSTDGGLHAHQIAVHLFFM